MSIRANAQKIYEMLGQGQGMEAFEQFYADNVVMVEATGEVREGKEANREYEKNFFGSVKAVHGGGVTSLTADEEKGHAMVESWMDIEFQDGNRVKMEEVAVQQWENGKIVHERFYYNPATMGM